MLGSTAGLRSRRNIVRRTACATGKLRLMLSPRLPFGELAALRDFRALTRRIAITRHPIAGEAEHKRKPCDNRQDGCRPPRLSCKAIPHAPSPK